MVAMGLAILAASLGHLEGKNLFLVLSFISAVGMGALGAGDVKGPVESRKVMSGGRIRFYCRRLSLGWKTYDGKRVILTPLDGTNWKSGIRVWSEDGQEIACFNERFENIKVMRRVTPHYATISWGYRKLYIGKAFSNQIVVLTPLDGTNWESGITVSKKDGTPICQFVPVRGRYWKIKPASSDVFR